MKIPFLKNKCRLFLQDVGGVAAVEFALILPIFMLLVFGAYGTFVLLQKHSSMDRSSAILAELISRYQDIDRSKADELFAIAESLNGSLANDSSYKVVISSVYNEFDSDSNYDLTITWSESNIRSEKLKLVDLPRLNLPTIAEGESLIVATTEVNYTPQFLQDIVGEIMLDGLSIRRPRVVALVVGDF